MPPNGDLAHILGVCPDWGWNWWPLSLWEDTELHQSGWDACLLELVFLFPSGRYPEVKLLIHMVVLFFNFLRNLYFIFYSGTPIYVPTIVHKGPWLVWLSGLSTSLRTKRLPVRFPVGARACVVGWVSGGGCMRGSHTLVFLSPSFFLPSPLCKNK